MTETARTMGCVFLALDFYSHISDALRGKFIAALAAKYRIVVITQYLDQAEAGRRGYFQHPGVYYQKLDLHYPRLWPTFNQFLRHSLVREYDDFAVTRRFYYRPTHPLRVRLLTALGSLLPKRCSGTAPFTRLEQRIVRPSRAFRDLVRRHRPVLLVTARPGLSPFEAEMVLFAKNLGIPTAAININYDNPYSVAKFYRNTDYLCVWNDIMAGEVRRFQHYPPQRLFVTGCLRFDHYFRDVASGRLRDREAFLASKHLDPRKKTIVYLGPSPIMYPPRKALFDLLIGLKQSGRLSGDPNILIRLHPHDVAEPYRGWEKIPGLWVERAGEVRQGDRETRGQKVEMEEDDILNLTATLTYADVVINFASTMIIEASIFDTPVISIAFPEAEATAYEFEFNKALAESGAVAMARSAGELTTIINRYLQDPSLERQGRRQVVERYVKFTDGRSYERIARAVDEIAARIQFENAGFPQSGPHAGSRSSAPCPVVQLRTGPHDADWGGNEKSSSCNPRSWAAVQERPARKSSG